MAFSSHSTIAQRRHPRYDIYSENDFYFGMLNLFFCIFGLTLTSLPALCVVQAPRAPLYIPFICAALLGARVSERMCMLWLAHMPFMDVCDSNGSADVDDIRIYEHPARRLNKKIQQIYTIYLVSSIALWWAITRMLDTDLCVVCWGRRSRNWSDKNRKKALATTPYLTSIHADSLQNCMSSLRVLANDCECILANGHGPFRATVATPRLEQHTSRYARERLTPKIKRVLEDQNDEFITCVYIPSHPIHNNNNNKSNNNEHEQFYRMGVRIVIVYSQMMCVCAVQCDA